MWLNTYGGKPDPACTGDQKLINTWNSKQINL